MLSTLDEVGMGLNPSPVGWGEKDREKNNHISWELQAIGHVWLNHVK